MDGENVHDSLKALEEVRLDAEKGMFMFDGAIRLLCKQEEDCAKTGCCPVCQRELTTRKMLHQCARLLHAKREAVSKVRNEEAVHLHDSCIAAMNEIGPKVITFPSPSSTRVAFYLRTGELSEWRQQKLDCMASMSCFACSRPFTPEEFSSFLKRVDHRAAVMERELHIHPKFCPFETLETSERQAMVSDRELNISPKFSQLDSIGTSDGSSDSSDSLNNMNDHSKRAKWLNNEESSTTARTELII